MHTVEDAVRAFPLDPELAVVEDDPDRGQRVLDSSGEDLGRHVERAVADDADSRPVPVGGRGAEHARRGPAHLRHARIDVPDARAADRHIGLRVLGDVSDVDEDPAVGRGESLTDLMAEPGGMHRSGGRGQQRLDLLAPRVPTRLCFFSPGSPARGDPGLVDRARSSSRNTQASAAIPASTG